MPENDKTGVSVPASSSYVQTLIAPAGEGVPPPTGEVATPPPVEQPAASGETAPPETPPAEGTQPQPEEAEVEQIIQQIAQEWGVDPNDPAHRRALKRIADGQAHIRKLQTENETLKGAKPPGETTKEPAGDATLTEFERELFAEGEEKPPAGPPAESAKPAAPPAPAAPGTPPVLPTFAEVAGTWEGPKDAYRELTAAWSRQSAEGEPSPDFDKVNQVEQRQFLLRFLAMGVPRIEKIVADRLREAIGDFEPDLRRGVEDRRDKEAGDFARAELGKDPEMKVALDELFKIAEGPLIRYDGRDFPNSGLNRILVANPELMEIRVLHEDPNTALKLTRIKQYRAAARILRSQQAQPGLSPAKAKELVEAGAKMGAREELDRARYGINAGAGAGGLAGRPGAGYIKELSELPGEVSISTLLGS